MTVEPIDWSGRIAALLRPMPADADPGMPSTLSEQGALLTVIGTALQGIVEKTISRRIGVYDYTEAYDGNDRDTLFLLNDPLVSVSAVSLNGTAFTTIEDPEAAPTYPPPTIVLNAERNGIVRTDGALFSAGVRNVIVSYSAGIDPTLNDSIIEAIAFWGATLYKRKDQLGISSTNVMGMQTTFVNDAPAIVKAAIDPFRRTFVP